jgi:hypothetical protein
VLKKYSIFLYCLFGLLPLYSCSGIFDLPKAGSLNKRLYYDVDRNEVVCNYTDKKMTGMWFWIKKKGMPDSLQRISFDETISSFRMPILEDSISNTSFTLSISLTDTHWREAHHMDITKKKVSSERYIYARSTYH